MITYPDAPAFAGSVSGSASKGMTIREWYASLAMHGLVATNGVGVHGTPKEQEESMNTLTRRAFQMADAMIDQSSKM